MTFENSAQDSVPTSPIDRRSNLADAIISDFVLLVKITSGAEAATRAEQIDNPTDKKEFLHILEHRELLRQAIESIDQAFSRIAVKNSK